MKEEKIKLTLILGDCLKVLPTLPDNSVDLVLTSPPFKDEEINQNYYEWLEKILNELKRISKIILMFNSSTRLVEICRRFEPERVLIWNKKRTEQPYRYEPIFLWNNSDEKINKYIWNDCFSYLPLLKQTVPYENPYELYFNILKMFKKVNLVLDPFLGSGTTMKVARDLKKSCIGIEINPKYIEICKKRLNWGSSLSDKIEWEFKDMSDLNERRKN
jgi:site-specific DNA-methyltransferase (adenine-specific)